MTLFIALNEIREHQDASLQFDFVCRAGICGSCAMVINGRPTLACRTLTKNLGTEITLAPLPFFELIGDLSVDTGKWMRGMSERLEGWLHMANPDPDLTAARAADGARACRQDLRARPLHRMRLLRRRLRDRAHARGLRRRRRIESRRALPARSRATLATTRTSTTSSATTTACSAACRCWPATTSARRTCRSRRRSRSCGARWWRKAFASRGTESPTSRGRRQRAAACGCAARSTRRGEVVAQPKPVVFVARDLHKIYRMGEVEVRALSDLALEIYEGEFVVLLGPSGSGKSTLLNILGGLDTPTSGEAFWRDHNLATAGEAELTLYRREHVGFVFQFYNLIPSLTVRENVALVTDIATAPMSAGRRDRACRARGACRSLPLAALRRRAAEGRDRTSDRQASRCAAVRRAHRCARLPDRQDRARGHRADQRRARHDRRRHHAQRCHRRDGGSRAPPRGWSHRADRRQRAPDHAGGARLVKALDRKLVRDIWHLRSQVVTVALVVGSAFAGFTGSIATYESLVAAREAFYESARFAHVFADLKRAPRSLERRLGEIPGVSDAETTVVFDTTLDVPGVAEPLIGRMIGLLAGRTGAAESARDPAGPCSRTRRRAARSWSRKGSPPRAICIPATPLAHCSMAGARRYRSSASACHRNISSRRRAARFRMIATSACSGASASAWPRPSKWRARSTTWRCALHRARRNPQ